MYGLTEIQLINAQLEHERKNRFFTHPQNMHRELLGVWNSSKLFHEPMSATLDCELQDHVTHGEWEERNSDE